MGDIWKEREGGCSICAIACVLEPILTLGVKRYRPMVNLYENQVTHGARARARAKMLNNSYKV